MNEGSVRSRRASSHRDKHRKHLVHCFEIPNGGSAKVDAVHYHWPVNAGVFSDVCVVIASTHSNTHTRPALERAFFSIFKAEAKRGGLTGALGIVFDAGLSFGSDGWPRSV